MRQKEKRKDQGRIRLVQEKTVGLDLSEADRGGPGRLYRLHRLW